MVSAPTRVLGGGAVFASAAGIVASAFVRAVSLPVIRYVAPHSPAHALTAAALTPWWCERVCRAKVHLERGEVISQHVGFRRRTPPARSPRAIEGSGNTARQGRARGGNALNFQTGPREGDEDTRLQVRHTPPPFTQHCPPTEPLSSASQDHFPRLVLRRTPPSAPLRTLLLPLPPSSFALHFFAPPPPLP